MSDEEQIEQFEAKLIEFSTSNIFVAIYLVRWIATTDQAEKLAIMREVNENAERIVIGAIAIGEIFQAAGESVVGAWRAASERRSQ